MGNCKSSAPEQSNKAGCESETRSGMHESASQPRPTAVGRKGALEVTQKANVSVTTTSKIAKDTSVKVESSGVIDVKRTTQQATTLPDKENMASGPCPVPKPVASGAKKKSTNKKKGKGMKLSEAELHLLSEGTKVSKKKGNISKGGASKKKNKQMRMK